MPLQRLTKFGVLDSSRCSARNLVPLLAVIFIDLSLQRCPTLRSRSLRKGLEQLGGPLGEVALARPDAAGGLLGERRIDRPGMHRVYSIQDAKHLSSPLEKLSWRHRLVERGQAGQRHYPPGSLVPLRRTL